MARKVSGRFHLTEDRLGGRVYPAVWDSQDREIVAWCATPGEATSLADCMNRRENVT